MLSKVFLDSEGGHGGDLLFAHQPHGFIAELIGMVDRGYTRPNGIEGARLAGGVNGNAFADTPSFSDGDAEFGFGVLVWGRELPLLKRVCASFVDFDEIGAFFNLFANDGHEFGGIIGVSGVRENVLLGVVADGILVAA